MKFMKSIGVKKSCRDCTHISVCVIYLGLDEVLTDENSPVTSVDRILVSVAAYCKLYSKKESKNETDGSRGPSC